MELKRASLNDAETIWNMQKEAFSELLDKYRDYDISPANEPVERIEERLLQPYTYFYYIVEDNNTVGAVRVVDMKDGGRKRISPIFIMKEFRNRGYAQRAIAEAENIHGHGGWELETILQEKGNCYLYEKMGYRKTGRTDVINERMTIVYYEKINLKGAIFMPFINVKTNANVTKEKAESIKSALGTAITAIPGKSEGWLMVGVEGDYTLYFKGSDAPAAMVEVQIYGSSSDGAMSELTSRITGILSDALAVPPDRVYVSYMCTENWGWNGNNF